LTFKKYLVYFGWLNLQLGVFNRCLLPSTLLNSRVCANDFAKSFECLNGFDIGWLIGV